MPITREQLIEAIKPDSQGRHTTLKAIGALHGVSRQGIRQRLVAEGLTKPMATLNSHCPTCKSIRYINPDTGKPMKCRPCNSTTVTFICPVCGQEKILSRSQYKARFRPVHQLRTGPRTVPLTCSRQCAGHLFGTMHGRGAQLRARNAETAKE